jgi:Flp pilus assembly protein TadB
MYRRVGEEKRKTRRAQRSNGGFTIAAGCYLAVIVILVSVAPLPVFSFFFTAAAIEVPVLAMRFHFPALIVDDLIVVPWMIIMVFVVVIADVSGTA